MCIRDRYQRRVHGIFWVFSKSKMGDDPWLQKIQRSGVHIMCEANAYLVDKSGQASLFLEAVDKVEPEEEGIRLVSIFGEHKNCLLYTSPSPRDLSTSRMPSSA
eukprot:TRINITY_DN68965_c0_g1_i1.p4 TRINITY_DN68965_c0_g1~~TRINITY_DN68965_c0_g1_i1.p4  ORF type:complete len:104 (+),score=23.23 TRINITY_DN68965_c0_g1_i1:180-491(+)